MTITIDEPTALVPIDDVTRRQFVVGGLSTAALVASGCGDHGDGDGSGDGTRVFTDDRGKAVRIPTRAERIVALDPQSLEAALTVGAPVVGSSGRSAIEPFSDAVVDLATDIEVVAVSEVNIEAVVALGPDLLLGQSWVWPEQLTALERIAPFVAVDYWADESYTTTRWVDHLRGAADACGRSAGVDSAIAELDDAIAALTRELSADASGIELSVIYVNIGGWFFHTSISFQGELLERIGFARPANQASVTDTDRVYLSYEEIEQAAGDVILVAVEADAGPAYDTLETNPVWRSLDAVRNGRAHRVGGHLWLTGGGPLAGRAMVADLRQILVG